MPTTRSQSKSLEPKVTRTTRYHVVNANAHVIQLAGRPTGYAFAKDNEPTDAEFQAGRASFNTLLFREYDAWHEAFVSEASEDDEGSMSGDDRWLYHAARKLMPGTSLTLEQAYAVAGAWLIEHKKQ